MSSFHDIPRYVGLYRVDKAGNVYSVRSSRLLKHGLGEGYPKVTLYRDKRAKSHSIHRLLAEMFIPNPNKLPLVNHKDGDKLNFSLDNLEWCSFEDNTRHAVDMGLVVAWNKGHKSDHLKKTCERCGTKYIAVRGRQRFCSARCSAQWRVETHPDLMRRARDGRGRFAEEVV